MLSRRVTIVTAACLLVAACATGGQEVTPGPSQPAGPPATRSPAPPRPQPAPAAQRQVGPLGPLHPAARTGASNPGAPGAPAAPGGCAIFPADSIWHADVSRLPRDPRSATLVAAIGTGEHLHPDFGAGLIDGAPFGMPITAVGPGTARVPVRFEYSDESDPGPYPIPPAARIEGGPNASGDRHVILHDGAGCRLYELYDAHRQSDGSWRAGSGAVFDLRSNRLRPAGWTSADAAGLPILAGLVRYDEVAAGRIDHAIRITVPRSRAGYLWPARHAASDETSAGLPPMGLRLRMRADVDISRLPRAARVIAQAFKTYGVIVADNGSPWYFGGTQDDRWDNDALNKLKSFTGADFEVVDTAGLQAAADSGAVRGG